MHRAKKTYLAEMLLQQELITREQLDNAINLQKKSDKKIGELLVELGYIKEEQLLLLLSEQLHIPYIDLKHFPISQEVIKLLPEFSARHYRVIVLKQEENSYLVGMVDPLDIIAQDEVNRLLKKKINIALIREEDLLSLFNSVYRRADEITHYAETLSEELKPNLATELPDTKDTASEDLPVVNLLRSIFQDAAQVNATDIHIEPDEKVLRIRLRVDGVLQEQTLSEQSISQALVQRIKLMSGLDIAEKRLPQDGRFTMHIGKKYYDVRVSTIPIQFGESVVLRLLNQAEELITLDRLGMPTDIYEYYRQLLTATYGLILFVGPTGSGKTTTMYASLNALNKPGDKIITVEDPVEYRMPRINQIQVNTKINLTFATILRSILRQDPDIIMIGELRDQETVEIALRAAMTGHLVLATLHTNDSISSATRLLDMGAEGYLVASVLRAAVAQRLVRRICRECSQEHDLLPAEKVWLDASGISDIAAAKFKAGIGCSRCNYTGYRGRAAVFELLPVTAELADGIRQQDLGKFIESAKKQPLYHPLLISGIELAEKGVTTIDEVMRMMGEI